MWYLLVSARQLPDDLANNLTQLLHSTMRRMIFVCTLLYVVAQLALSATWPMAFAWRVLPIAGLLLVTGGLAYAVLPRTFLVSQLLWQGGVWGAIAYAAVAFQWAPVLWLLAFLPLTVVVTMGWRVAILAWIATWAVPLYLQWTGLLTGIENPLLVGIALAGAWGTVLGWAATASLLTVLEWLLHADSVSRHNLDDARQHRSQLFKAVKELDQLNYRLARTNAALAAAWHTAEEALHFKAEFVSNVSHELRTPLNLIIGFSEVMIMSPESYGGQKLPGSYRSDINAIYTSAKHLMTLVDDVLDLGRIDANQVAFTRDEVPMAVLLDDVQELVRDHIAAKGLRYSQRIDPDLPLLNVDRLRIRQVLLNLLVNAVRFTARGAIHVDVSRHQNQILVRVIDSGQGISPEELPHVFEPFYSMAEPTVTNWPRGKGLGLPISKKYVELHGGRMGVESEEGRGTTFWFTLPQNDQRNGVRKLGGLGSKRAGNHQERVDRLLITLFEDSDALLFVQRYLDGYQLVAADSVDHAVALAGTLHPLAVITDQSSNLVDHATFAPAWTQVTVPVLNFPCRTNSHIAAMLGVDGFLVKPVAGQQFLQRVDQLGIDLTRVLIADGGADMVRLLRRVLRARVPVNQLLAAYNGDEAIQRALDERPSLIVVSYELVDSSGRPVYARLRAESTLAGTHCLVISAQQGVDLALDRGATFQLYQRDGFQVGQLVQMMRTLLDELAPSAVATML